MGIIENSKINTTAGSIKIYAVFDSTILLIFFIYTSMRQRLQGY
jgi:hypothetical protein